MMKLTNENGVYTPKDPSIYDLPTLIQWYIDLRQYKSDLERSIEPQIAQADDQMAMIEKELKKRMVESGLKSIQTDYGTVTREQRTIYLMVDNDAFRQWLMANPEVGALLIQGVSHNKVKTYLEEGGALPDGLVADHFIDISVMSN